MIRNIIFDMVGVLMRFDTESYIEEHHLSEEDVAILRKEVFRSLEWAMQDRGSISTQEAERRICDRVPPHLCFAVHDLTGDFVYLFSQIRACIGAVSGKKSRAMSCSRMS